MFVGRKKELEDIRNTLKEPKQNILIYGKRRIGKSTLILKACESLNRPVFVYECLKTSLAENLKEMSNKLSKEGLIPSGLFFDSILSLFNYLNQHNKGLIVFIDEYPYLKENENNNYIDSCFQNIIDNYTSNINIIISGSYVSIMKEMLHYKNELFGRFHLVINLQELDYLEASEFYSDLPTKDKIAFYSIFGGSPFVNSLLSFDKGLEWNIKNHLLNIASPISLYIEFVVLSELLKEGNATSILGVIKNSKKKYKDIITSLNYSTNGLLDKHLKTLIDMDIINKVFPINKKEDSHRSLYEISDNILRFYYTYIYKNKTTIITIGVDSFYDIYIAKTLNEFISRRFESICQSYFSLAVKKGLNKSIKNIGTYFYDNKVDNLHGEFDCVIQNIDDTYSVYEAKYLSKPIKKQVVEKEIEQIKNIKEFQVKDIGFFLISGCEKLNEEIKIIDGNELYSL